MRLDDRAEYDAREDGWVRRTLLPEEWVLRRKRAAMAAAAAAAAAQGCTAAAIAVVGTGDHCSCYTHPALTALTILTIHTLTRWGRRSWRHDGRRSEGGTL
jgi:hypothetical protein